MPVAVLFLLVSHRHYVRVKSLSVTTGMDIYISYISESHEGCWIWKPSRLRNLLRTRTWTLLLKLFPSLFMNILRAIFHPVIYWIFIPFPKNLVPNGRRLHNAQKNCIPQASHSSRRSQQELVYNLSDYGDFFEKKRHAKSITETSL